MKIIIINNQYNQYNKYLCKFIYNKKEPTTKMKKNIFKYNNKTIFNNQKD